MAFAKKTWKDRIAEFPTRRRLTKEDNTSELVTVAREEGTLSQEGDAFSAENMNDLENRIDAEFTAVNGKLNSLSTIGKKLWSGSFTEGTITVPGLSKYIIFIMSVGGVVCIGNISYGIGGLVEYGLFSTHTYGYRFTPDISLETLTIDSINKGGSDGTGNVAVTDIYGLL